MSKSPSCESMDRLVSTPNSSRKSNGPSTVDEHENTMVTVSRLVEQLHNTRSEAERELITARLLGMAKARKDSRKIIGNNNQAMPLLISTLRSSTEMAKLNVAAMLSVLCRDDELRLKVLLGGCTPPLLSLLKSNSVDARRVAAEALNEVSAGGLSDDPVGMKIFVTEGVVPTLWEELNKRRQDKMVQGFVIGALRNLCGDKGGHWTLALDGSAVDVILRLLNSENAVSQSNAASLLARIMSSFPESVQKVIDSGAIATLILLVGSDNDISARASAADALSALTAKSMTGQTAVKDANGVNILIEAVVAPYKDGVVQGETTEALQEHATRALANVFGGITPLILHLSKAAQSPRLAAPVADILGALGFALRVFEEKSDSKDDPLDATKIEDILIKLLKPRDNKVFQERMLEAMGNLYGNAYLSQFVDQAEGKRSIVGLAMLATGDVQEYLIHCLIKCCNKVPIWEAIGKKEGIQKLITFLDLATEQHQLYVSHLLAVLTDQVDDSKWAITAAGGIPPLVQLLEKGSQKATEDAIHVIWNLCGHSEDIRACVETAGAIPALLGLLKYGGPNAQESSAAVLKKLVRTADSATINLILELLVGDSPTSKARVIEVLGHVLGVAPDKDLILKGTASNKGLRSLVKSLKSPNEETQVNAASVLADLFISRLDICENLATDEILDTCMKLLANAKVASAQSIQALKNLPRPAKKKEKKKYSVGEGDMRQFINEARTSSIEEAEAAVASLASILGDHEAAEQAMGEDIGSALIRVLGEGSCNGKKSASRALYQLLKRYSVGDVLSGDAQCRSAIMALLDSLKDFKLDSTDALSTLKVLALLSKAKQDKDFTCTPLSAIAESPKSLAPLFNYLSDGPPSLQDKAIEIFSRLCGDQPGILGDMLVDNAECIASIVSRIINTSSLEVKVGGSALLICAARVDKRKTLNAMEATGFLKPFVAHLVDMTKPRSNCSSLKIELGHARGLMGKRAFQKGDYFDVSKPAIVLGGNVALWLLSIISSFSAKNKLVVKEAGGVDALCDKLARHASNQQANFEDAEGVWISSMLLAVLFQESEVTESPSTSRTIPSLAHLLRSDEVIDKFFAAQALASLVSNGSQGICSSIATSESVAGLISLIGYVESDMTNLLALSEEFSLVRNPDQVILESLFENEEVRVGPIAQDTIPFLVDLLRPTPGRLTAPLFAVELLTRIADASEKSKVVMGESGILEALTKYLSLSPHNLSEASIAELMNILFTSLDLVEKASVSTLSQLVAVLHMGSRKARLSAAKALAKLFEAESIRDAESARQAVQPLVDMLDTAAESDQNIALHALIKLTSRGCPKSSYLLDLEGDLFGCMYRMLTSASSDELKTNAAQLCFVLFSDERGRTHPMGPEFIQPLVDLIQSDSLTTVEHGVCALERLLDDDHQAELAATPDNIDLLVDLITGTNYRLIEGCVCSLIKMGKDRPARKVDMVNSGVLDSCIEILPDAPSSLCSSIFELFRILTNTSAVARSSTGARIVEPLFEVLHRPDFNLWGQHSGLQALLNVLEKPQSLEALKLTPTQVMEPLIPFLNSPSQTIQELATELLSNLLEHDYFQEDITSTSSTGPLVKLAGIGILTLQETAVTALEKISTNWPKVIVDAGGINEISKIILQEDPLPPDDLWESASIILSNILYSDTEYYFQVPVDVLVGLLNSSIDSVIALTINALIQVQQRDASTVEEMTDAGAVDALLDLIKSHQCEEESARLLEALVSNPRVRERKVSRFAISPLSQYLLDPLTSSEPAKLLVALCLGKLSYQEGLAKSGDAIVACKALIKLLEDHPTEEVRIVATCALQNFVMHSRANRRAVAEAGGVFVIQELLLATNLELAGQAAVLIRFLFCNYTLQEFVSNDLVERLTGALERQLMAESTINEEILRTLHVIFTNFPKLHVSEATTQCIPHLVGALRLGSDAAQESVLDTLCVLKQSWQSMSTVVAKAQAIGAAGAVPVLQSMMRTFPPSFHNRIDSLLHCLPGCLNVTVIRGENLMQPEGSTSALFCELHISNGTTQQTGVVCDSSCPEWEESFSWSFDMPPKGLKLHITCKNKNAKESLGRLTLWIDKVITDGVSCGLFYLTYESSREDNYHRALELDIVWSSGALHQNE